MNIYQVARARLLISLAIWIARAWLVDSVSVLMEASGLKIG